MAGGRVKATAPKARKQRSNIKRRAPVVATAAAAADVMGPPKRKLSGSKKATKGSAKATSKRRKAKAPKAPQADSFTRVNRALVTPDVAFLADALLALKNPILREDDIPGRVKHALRFMRSTMVSARCANGPEMLGELLELAKIDDPKVTSIYLALALIYSTEMVEENFNASYEWFFRFSISPYKLMFCNKQTDVIADAIFNNVVSAFSKSKQGLTSADVQGFCDCRELIQRR